MSANLKRIMNSFGLDKIGKPIIGECFLNLFYRKKELKARNYSKLAIYLSNYLHTYLSIYLSSIYMIN
jgi:hypothetical protein